MSIQYSFQFIYKKIFYRFFLQQEMANQNGEIVKIMKQASITLQCHCLLGTQHFRHYKSYKQRYLP